MTVIQLTWKLLCQLQSRWNNRGVNKTFLFPTQEHLANRHLKSNTKIQFQILIIENVYLTQ